MTQKLSSLIYTLKNYKIKSIVQNIVSIAISDAVVVSFQKSGRTWLRLMFGKVLSEQYKIDKIKLDAQWMTIFKPLPNVFFSHGGCIKNYNKINFQKMFSNKKIILLVRDPRAVIVSLFHDHTKRNHFYKGNSQSEFIKTKWGLDKVITFMNGWAEEFKQRNGKNILILRYEDLYTNTARELKKFLDFLEVKADEDIIDQAVEYGSVKNMRRMELKNSFDDPRMSPGNINDQNSYRTRKCKLGSFREELSVEDLNYVTQEIKGKLDPLFGYPQ